MAHLPGATEDIQSRALTILQELGDAWVPEVARTYSIHNSTTQCTVFIQPAAPQYSTVAKVEVDLLKSNASQMHVTANLYRSKVWEQGTYSDLDWMLLGESSAPKYQNINTLSELREISFKTLSKGKHLPFDVAELEAHLLDEWYMI